MASANGSLTTSSHPAEPSSPADNFAHKRKRGDDAATVPNGIVAHPPSAPTPAAQTQRDLLEILQPYDTTPSFLRYELTDSNDTMTDEPSHKKARLTGESAAITIAGKLVNGAYTTLHGLKSDASHVSKAIETCLRVKAKENQGHLAGRLLVEDLKLLQRVKAFEELIKDVVEKEIDYEAMHRVSSDKNDEKNIVHDHNSRFDSRMNASSTVLTLFGNAPTPKQLFSSMQHHVPTSKTDSMVKSELPVEEMSLPNGITATKIMPAPTEEGKKAPTFDETFAPPYNLPALQPPKVHKRSSTRDNVITWEFKDPIYRGSKKGGYTVQTVTDGNWLGYGGVDSAADTLSQKEKRRQRDRALSSGAESVKEPPSKAALEEEQARQEEALFRRAYSSFAPSYDNAKAIIPVQTKANIWWQKVGERRYKEVFGNDEAVIDPVLLEEPQPEQQDDFGRAIDDLEELEDGMPDFNVSRSKTDVDQVLREISELLETLASHQRIRNTSLSSSNSVARTPISPAPILASRIGKPDEPAEDEISTYHSLRRELVYLILKLPPYAVAKLDGDQLADLGVSKLIPFETKDVKGTLEEDHVARLAKYTAMQTAAGIASLTRGNSTSGQHYNTTAQRTPAIGQAANTRYGQSAQYNAIRPPQPQFQRSTSSSSQYGTPVSVHRPSYGQQPNQYTRPPTAQQAYSQANGQHYYRSQQPSAGYSSYAQQYSQQTPQTQQRPAYASSQPLQQFQQRAPNAVPYQASVSTPQQTHSPLIRTASPAKLTGHPPPPNVQPRPVYQYAQQQQQHPGSGRATPSYPSQPATPVNGFQRPPPQPIAARAASGTPQPPPSLAQGQPNGHA